MDLSTLEAWKPAIYDRYYDMLTKILDTYRIDDADTDGESWWFLKSGHLWYVSASVYDCGPSDTITHTKEGSSVSVPEFYLLLDALTEARNDMLELLMNLIPRPVLYAGKMGDQLVYLVPDGKVWVGDDEDLPNQYEVD